MRPSTNVLLRGVVVGGLAAGFVWLWSLPRGNPVLDTWPVGGVLDCLAGVARCDELTRVGLFGLDDREPGHATVVSSQLHHEGGFTNDRGDVILMTRSGDCCSVLVMTLADGSQRAIGVGYPGVSRTAIAIPWEHEP